MVSYLVALNFSSVGCVAHAQATGYAEADAPVTAETDAPVTFTETPTLVTVDPDVWVVRDSDVPVYYVDNYYWVYRANVWHRSRSYDGGWARVEASVVPRTIVSRNHGAYVHYRGAANAATRPAPRERLAGRSDNREHEAERIETAREKHEERQEHAEHGGGPANVEAAREAERREAELAREPKRSETMARRRTTTGTTKRRGSRARRTTDKIACARLPFGSSARRPSPKRAMTRSRDWQPRFRTTRWLSLSPLLAVAIAIAGLVFGREAAQGHIAEQLQTIFGVQASEAVQALVAHAQRPGAGIVSAVVGGVVLLLGLRGSSASYRIRSTRSGRLLPNRIAAFAGFSEIAFFRSRWCSGWRSCFWSRW